MLNLTDCLTRCATGGRHLQLLAFEAYSDGGRQQRARRLKHAPELHRSQHLTPCTCCLGIYAAHSMPARKHVSTCFPTSHLANPYSKIPSLSHCSPQASLPTTLIVSSHLNGHKGHRMVAHGCKQNAEPGRKETLSSLPSLLNAPLSKRKYGQDPDIGGK